MGIVQTNPTKYKPELIMCLRHVCLFSNTYSIPRVWSEYLQIYSVEMARVCNSVLFLT